MITSMSPRGQHYLEDMGLGHFVGAAHMLIVMRATALVLIVEDTCIRVGLLRDSIIWPRVALKTMVRGHVGLRVTAPRDVLWGMTRGWWWWEALAVPLA